MNATGRQESLFPEVTRRSRRGTVRRYSETDETTFHTAMAANPEDETTPLVYADWLDEHDRPALAEMIRRHVQERQDRRTTNINDVSGVWYGNYGPPGFRIASVASQNFVNTFPDKPHDMLTVVLPVRGDRHNQQFYLSSWVPRRDAKRLVTGLTREGHPLLPPGDEREEDGRRRFDADTTYDPPATLSRRPRRMGRAPTDEVVPLIDSSGDATYDPNHHADMILADKLGDYGDPLETVVRRDLSYRSSDDASNEYGPTVFDLNLDRHIEQIAGVPRSQLGYISDLRRDCPISGGEIRCLTHGVRGKHPPKSCRVTWATNNGTYIAAMSVAEAAHLLDEHGIAHNLHPTDPTPLSRRGGVTRYSHEAFGHHIEANPDEDTPQLVYADWLDENGNPETASRLRWMVGAKNHVRGASGRPKHPDYGVSYSFWSPRRPEWYARSMAAWMIHKKLSDFVSDHPTKTELSHLLGVAYSHAVGVAGDGERDATHQRATELANQLDGEWQNLQEQGHEDEEGFLVGEARTASTLAGFAHAVRYLTTPAPGPMTSVSAMNAGLNGTARERGAHQQASYHFADFVKDNPPPSGTNHNAPEGRRPLSRRAVHYAAYRARRAGWWSAGRTTRAARWSPT